MATNGPSARAAEGMQRPREQLLPRPALASQQDRRVAVRGLAEGVHHLAERLILPDNLREAVTGGELLLEQDVLGEDAVPVEGPVHQEQKVIGIDRLGQEVVWPPPSWRARHPRCCRRPSSRSRRRPDRAPWRPGAPRIRPPWGRSKVGQDDSRPVLPDRAHRVRLVDGLADLMPLRLEGVPQHVPERVLVLDDENLGVSFGGGRQRVCSFSVVGRRCGVQST